MQAGEVFRIHGLLRLAFSAVSVAGLRTSVRGSDPGHLPAIRGVAACKYLVTEPHGRDHAEAARDARV